MLRRSLVAGAAGALALSYLARAQGLPKITIGMSGWTGFAPLTLAEQAGLFRANGVEVETKFVPQRERNLALASGALNQLVIMVAVIAGSTRMDLVEAAYTLGSRPLGTLRRVVIPAAAPQIAETLRLVLGWAWTYVIVAELIGATSGIGHMIMDSQRLLDTGQMIFGIAVIGIIGLVTDLLFKAANRRLFPWAVL